MWKLISLEALCGSIYYKNWPPQRVSSVDLSWYILTFSFPYGWGAIAFNISPGTVSYSNKDVTKQGGMVHVEVWRPSTCQQDAITSFVLHSSLHNPPLEKPSHASEKCSNWTDLVSLSLKSRIFKCRLISLFLNLLFTHLSTKH